MIIKKVTCPYHYHIYGFVGLFYYFILRCAVKENQTFLAQLNSLFDSTRLEKRDLATDVPIRKISITSTMLSMVV